MTIKWLGWGGGEHSRSTEVEFLMMDVRICIFCWFTKWSLSMLEFENDPSRDIYDNVFPYSVINLMILTIIKLKINQSTFCLF